MQCTQEVEVGDNYDVPKSWTWGINAMYPRGTQKYFLLEICSRFPSLVCCKDVLLVMYLNLQCIAVLPSINDIISRTIFWLQKNSLIIVSWIIHLLLSINKTFIQFPKITKKDFLNSTSVILTAALNFTKCFSNSARNISQIYKKKFDWYQSLLALVEEILSNSKLVQKWWDTRR